MTRSMLPIDLPTADNVSHNYNATLSSARASGMARALLRAFVKLAIVSAGAIGLMLAIGAVAAAWAAARPSLVDIVVIAIGGLTAVAIFWATRHAGRRQ